MENVLNFIFSLFITYCLLSLFQFILKKITLFIKKLVIKSKKKKVIGNVDEKVLSNLIDQLKWYVWFSLFFDYGFI
ncbi:MAG: hypothetical protein PUA55_01545 [Mycoplasma sp.]|nr:hypothetical protein [Mycoplasma sp.]